MKAYCTIPAAASAEAEESLSREVKVNAKTLLGGVAATAFVLGMMAATAARSSSPVGARSQLSVVDHIGRHVERAACDDDDPDIYSDWIME